MAFNRGQRLDRRHSDSIEGKNFDGQNILPLSGC